MIESRTARFGFVQRLCELRPVGTEPVDFFLQIGDAASSFEPPLYRVVELIKRGFKSP